MKIIQNILHRSTIPFVSLRRRRFATHEYRAINGGGMIHA